MDADLFIVRRFSGLGSLSPEPEPPAPSETLNRLNERIAETEKLDYNVSKLETPAPAPGKTVSTET